MSDENVVRAWNPLDDLGISQRELNEIIVDEFEAHEGQRLPEPRTTFYGCGVYGLYYYGDLEWYEPISNEDGNFDLPIYVGKAVPEGSRTGGAHLESSTGNKLYQRLREHYRSIDQTENLSVDEFRVKYLITSSIWTRYCEQTLISYYVPWWNKYIDGFGDHDPGKGRANQERSMWDVLHPGRGWVSKRDLPHRNSEPNTWEEEIAPKIERDWSRAMVKSTDRVQQERQELTDSS